MESQHGGQTTAEVVITPGDVLFECPSCSKSMVIEESATGMIVECEQCHTNVIVPSKPTTPADTGQGEKADEFLLLAALKGDSVLLNNALAQGANINAAIPDGTTALMLAVEKGYEECVETLIARGADLDAKRADGQTAVMLSERAGQFQVLRKLWKAGAKRPSRFSILRMLQR
jgi:DNA-directed RNA polymerase subunit RPC12/RpoP